MTDITHIPFILRSMTDADVPFLSNSYLLSYAQDWVPEEVSKTIYFRNQTRILNYLLDTAYVLMICFPEDPDLLMGYVIYEYDEGSNLVLHYVYVKNGLRGQGLYKAVVSTLVKEDTPLIIQTHSTKLGRSVRYKLDRKLNYDPYYITNQRLLEEVA